jgi:cation diffusion facilitator family transporter
MSATGYEAQREKKRATLVSLLAAISLASLKLVAGLATGSLGVLAEAAHSGLDLVATLLTFLAIRLAARPPDETHTYGHGKIENLAALAETLLLLLTCVWIVHEGVGRLVSGEAQVSLSFWAFAVLFLSMGVDFSRSRLLRRIARKYKSQAMEADALHFSADMLSSLVVMLGLAAVWCARFAEPGSLPHALLIRADSLAALMVSGIVAALSLRLGGRAVNALLDASNSLYHKPIRAAVLAIPAVIEVRRLRLRDCGPVCFLDLTIVLPHIMTLHQAHDIVSQAEAAIRKIVPESDITIHYEPDEYKI